MAFLVQATTMLDDLEVMRKTLDWLHDEIGHFPGLVSLRVYQAQDDPRRVTLLEQWESEEAFAASFATYTVEQRAEFLARLGLTVDSFERSLWRSTELSYPPQTHP